MEKNPSVVLALECFGIARFAQVCDVVIFWQPIWHHSAMYFSDDLLPPSPALLSTAALPPSSSETERGLTVTGVFAGEDKEPKQPPQQQ